MVSVKKNHFKKRGPGKILCVRPWSGDSRSQSEEFNSTCKYYFKDSILPFEISIISNLMAIMIKQGYYIAKIQFSILAISKEDWLGRDVYWESLLFHINSFKTEVPMI